MPSLASTPARSAAATKFCPRCGLADVQETAADTSPLEITVGKNTYHVLDRIAIGSICSIYRCRFTASGGRGRIWRASSRSRCDFAHSTAWSPTKPTSCGRL